MFYNILYLSSAKILDKKCQNDDINLICDPQIIVSSRWQTAGATMCFKLRSNKYVEIWTIARIKLELTLHGKYELSREGYQN